VIRSGSHRLTQGLDRSSLVKIGARVAATWPLIVILGNDLYGTGFKPEAHLVECAAAC
jgi:hypothetical protein